MLIKLVGCDDGYTCPAVYVDTDDPATAVVRGDVVSDAQTMEQLEPLPAGEGAVRLPWAQLEEALQARQRR
jgi:hypothetical protein